MEFKQAITLVPHLISPGSEHAQKTFASSMGKCYHSTSGSNLARLGKITTSSRVHVVRPRAPLSHQPTICHVKQKKEGAEGHMNESVFHLTETINRLPLSVRERKTSFIYSSCSKTIQFSNQNVDCKWFSSKHKDQKWSDKFHSQLIYIMEGYASPDHHHTCIGLPCCDSTRTYASVI